MADIDAELQSVRDDTLSLPYSFPPDNNGLQVVVA